MLFSRIVKDQIGFLTSKFNQIIDRIRRRRSHQQTEIQRHEMKGSQNKESHENEYNRRKKRTSKDKFSTWKRRHGQVRKKRRQQTLDFINKHHRRRYICMLPRRIAFKSLCRELNESKAHQTAISNRIKWKQENYTQQIHRTKRATKATIFLYTMFFFWNIWMRWFQVLRTAKDSVAEWKNNVQKLMERNQNEIHTQIE